MVILILRVTGCFVVVRLARVCLDVYLVSPDVSWGLFLIIFGQTWCDKCKKIKLKEPYFIQKPTVQQPDKFSRRKGGLRGPRVWSIWELDSKALAEGLKANSTLTKLSLWFNEIADEGAKAWCLARMVRQKGIIARSTIQALESEVNERKENRKRSMQSEF